MSTEVANEVANETEAELEGIAVVGLAGRFPGARTIAELWKNLRSGVESISTLSDEELIADGVDPALVTAPNYVKARGVLGDAAELDAEHFGLNPREAALMDPQHRLFLECAWQALEDAGYGVGQLPGRAGVFAGQSMNTYLLTNVYPHLAHVASAESLEAAIGNDKDSLTTEVAYRFGMTGPAVTIQSSSSTSLTAIHYACQSLLGYECDLALAGGVSIHFPEKAGYLYNEGGTTSSDGHCHTFDASADGFVAGHGAGVVVLRRLADAVRDGDRIYAVVKGSAVNNDGAIKVSYMAPSVDGQADVIALAQGVAGVTADSIGYVECHGTATRLGDPIEIAALTQAFRQTSDRIGFCAIGSIKTNIGHLDAAAGVAGFIKTTLALYHGRIPPSLNYQSPNPAIDFATSPFFVNTKLAEWPESMTPRRAGVTSLGMGGTNAHCVLEEPPPPATTDAPRRRSQLVVVSARSDAALEAMTDRLAGHLEAHPEVDLADVAFTLQSGRARFAHRRILVATSTEDAAVALRARDPVRLLSGRSESEGRPVMFMFSGQGSQYPGMGRGLYDSEPVFRAAIDACAERLRALIDTDLREVLYSTDADRLRQTAWAQPALFAVEYALAKLWLSWGIRPHALIGHSIGEYVAACLAGVFALDDALALVAARGRLMQSMPPGAMLAIALPETAVRSLLGPELALAAVNGPTACVVAGPTAAIDALAERLVSEGQLSSRLHTSHAFHSVMMEPILAPFRAEVARVARRAPTIPILSNLSGAWMTADDAHSPEYWSRHLREPVRFAAGIGQLLGEPDAILLEVGPGQALASLARQHTARQAGHLILTSLRQARDPRHDGDVILETAGRLWLGGVEPDAAALADGKRRRVSLPTYPFERRRHWVEPKAHAGAGADSGLERAAPYDNDDNDGNDADARRPPAKWFYRPVWAKAPLAAAGSSAAERIWVFSAETAGLADSVVAKGGGGAVSLQPGAAGLASFLELVRALDETPRSLIVVTDRARSVAGEAPSPEGAMLVGAARVVGQELVHLDCRSVDIVVPPRGSYLEHRVTAQIAAEAGATDTTAVAYRGGERYIERWEPVAAGATGAPRADGVTLIVGGLGTVGRAHARALAKQGHARLALVQRAPEKHADEIRALEALGAEVLTIAADATDGAAMSAAVEQTRQRFGALHGVIFAAGDVGAGLFRTNAELDDAAASAIVLPRVHGLAALARAVEGQTLDFCHIASSLASILGGVGRAAYAAATSYLDAFAEAERHRSPIPWTSVAWDAWQTDAAVANPFGDTAISGDEGGAAFLALLALDAGARVAVSTTSLSRRLARPEASGASKARTGLETGAAPRPALATGYVAPANDVEAEVARIWQEALGIAEVGIHDNFFDLGGNSLVGVRLIARLTERFGVPIRAVSIYEGPTVHALSLLITGGANAGDAAPALAADRGARRRAKRQRQTLDEPDR